MEWFVRNSRSLSVTVITLGLVALIALSGGCAGPSKNAPAPASISPQATASPAATGAAASPAASPSGAFFPGAGGGDASESIEAGSRGQSQVGKKGIQKLQQIDSQHSQGGLEP